MNCYLIDCYSVECLMQLSLAVGPVHIARPVVDYESYLSREADSHSEGIFLFLFIITEMYVLLLSMNGQSIHFYFSCPRLQSLVNELAMI